MVDRKQRLQILLAAGIVVLSGACQKNFKADTELNVSISSSGIVSVDGQWVTFSEVTEIVESRVEQDPDAVGQITIHPDTPYLLTDSLQNALIQSGLRRVTIALDPEDR